MSTRTPKTPGFLNALAAEIATRREATGFERPTNDLGHRLLLITSEICEAQSELRDGRGLTEIYYPTAEAANGPHGPLDKPEGFPVEMADAFIRILDTMYDADIDIDAVVKLKMDFNATRPRKHGRQF